MCVTPNSLLDLFYKAHQHRVTLIDGIVLCLCMEDLVDDGNNCYIWDQ